MVLMVTPKTPSDSCNPDSESQKPKCLVPNCEAEARSRGVCRNCMAVFYREMRAKKVTERKLIEKGLLLPKIPLALRRRSPAGLAIKGINGKLK